MVVLVLGLELSVAVFDVDLDPAAVVAMILGDKAAELAEKPPEVVAAATFLLVTGAGEAVSAKSKEFAG